MVGGLHILIQTITMKFLAIALSRVRGSSGKDGQGRKGFKQEIW
jgi:hypothetical protein